MTKKILNFLILLSIFLDSAMLTRKPVNVFLYYVFYLIFLLAYILWTRTIKFNKTFILLTICVTAISLINTYTNNGNSMLVFKQLFAILFSSTVFYMFISFNNFDIVKIYKDYISMAYYVCIIGLFQEFSFLINFKPGYDFSYIFSYWHGYETEIEYFLKVNSIVSEPAHLAIALSPAMYTSLNTLLDGDNVFMNKKRALVILLTFFLTGSALAMLGCLIALVLLQEKYSFLKYMFSKKYIAYTFLIVLVMSVATYSIYNLPFIKLRVDDSWKLVASKNPQRVAKEINLSTFAIYSNFLVAKESFLANPWIGSGLGTHSQNYDIFLGKYFKNDIYGAYVEINKDDACSLFIRLMSELGIFGFLILLVFMGYNYMPFAKTGITDYNLWLINNSIILFMVLRIIRFGNYSLLGFFLFAFLYSLSKKKFLINKLNAAR